MNNPKEASLILGDLIKKHVKNTSADLKEKKIDSSILPVYYLIGECYIKLNKVQKAKDFLIAAYWNSLKMNTNQN